MQLFTYCYHKFYIHTHTVHAVALAMHIKVDVYFTKVKSSVLRLSPSFLSVIPTYETIDLKFKSYLSGGYVIILCFLYAFM